MVICIMCHNPDTWHDFSQVKITMNKLQNKIKIINSKPTWKQSCQCHLGKVVAVSPGNNCAFLNCEQSCQYHLATIAPVSLGNNRDSVTWEQLC